MSSAVLRMRSRVSVLTDASCLKARLTVMTDTPLAFATSFMVGGLCMITVAVIVTTVISADQKYCNTDVVSRGRFCAKALPEWLVAFGRCQRKWLFHLPLAALTRQAGCPAATTA